MQYVKYIEWNE